jgi:hypothetical protein
MPSAFTYQGQLRKNNQPVSGAYDATFRLFNAESAGVQIGPQVTQPALPVQNGMFTVALDFGWGAFNGEGRWLESTIGCNGEPAVTLTPRTPLRPTPYALALPGMRTVPGSLDSMGNPTMNVIGGLVNGPISNTISPDSYNSVIAGGTNNVIDGSSALTAIGGGLSNKVNGDSDWSVIAGGTDNLIDHGADAASIAGGYGNLIYVGDATVIGGGYHNVISGTADGATIPGGVGALATFAGQQAFASGGFNSVPGTAQTSLFVLRNVTVNEQPTPLFTDGWSEEIVVPYGRSMVYDVQVIGESEQTTAFDVAAYHIVGLVNSWGGFLVSSTTTPLYEDHSECDAVIVAGPNNTLRIIVTGIAGNNFRWVASVRTTEVAWPMSTAMTAQDTSLPEKK